ncbi:MAG: hypothetical protein ACXWB9_09675 [Flavisolibacter sp.]
MKSYVMLFIVAAMFAIAALMGFLDESNPRGVFGLIGCISFVLAGIHWKRKAQNRP